MEMRKQKATGREDSQKERAAKAKARKEKYMATGPPGMGAAVPLPRIDSRQCSFSRFGPLRCSSHPSDHRMGIARLSK